SAPRLTATRSPSLHDALPILAGPAAEAAHRGPTVAGGAAAPVRGAVPGRGGGVHGRDGRPRGGERPGVGRPGHAGARRGRAVVRSEEHTSELQSRENLVCRPL